MMDDAGMTVVGLCIVIDAERRGKCFINYYFLEINWNIIEHI